MTPQRIQGVGRMRIGKTGTIEEGAAFLPKARKTGIWTSVKGSDDVEGPKTEGENVPEPEETKELASHGNFDVETGEKFFRVR